MDNLLHPPDSTAESGNKLTAPDNSGERRSFFRWLRRSVWAKIFLILVILAPTAYVMTITILLSKRQAGNFDFINGKIPGSGASMYKNLNGSQVHDLQKAQKLEMESVYLKNRMTLALIDSVYITLDLPDKLLSLEIKGVPVLKSKIYTIEMTRKFDKIGHNQLIAWCSSPFSLKKKDATIPKLPMVFKKAPKDTTEAKLSSSVPMPVDTGAVYYNLQFDRGLILDVEQVEEPAPEDAKVIRDYLSDKRKVAAIEAVKTALKMESPEQYMHIRILIKREDARAIYRAIPREASLALKL
jgi:hypothetical protein